MPVKQFRYNLDTILVKWKKVVFRWNTAMGNVWWNLTVLSDLLHRELSVNSETYHSFLAFDLWLLYCYFQFFNVTITVLEQRSMAKTHLGRCYLGTNETGNSLCLWCGNYKSRQDSSWGVFIRLQKWHSWKWFKIITAEAKQC